MDIFSANFTEKQSIKKQLILWEFSGKVLILKTSGKFRGTLRVFVHIAGFADLPQFRSPTTMPNISSKP